MPNPPVEVKKVPPTPAPARTAVPDVLQSFRSEIDRMFDRFSSTFGFPSLRRMSDTEPTWGYETSFTLAAPAVDVTEDDKAYKISAELPGMSEKDIDVSLTSDLLVIEGEKRREQEDKDKNRYVSERSYGSFVRSFSLPDGVDRDQISADFSRGVLTITLPKTAGAQEQQKKIEVKAA